MAGAAGGQEGLIYRPLLSATPRSRGIEAEDAFMNVMSVGDIAVTPQDPFEKSALHTRSL
jgi:hypothetical protein